MKGKAVALLSAFAVVDAQFDLCPNTNILAGTYNVTNDIYNSTRDGFEAYPFFQRRGHDCPCSYVSFNNCHFCILVFVLMFMLTILSYSKVRCKMCCNR